MNGMDHVALPAGDIPAGVQWYQEHCEAEVLYQDATWAFMRIGGMKLALVTPGQHPPHVAVRVNEQELDAAARRAGMRIDTHRDGTRGIYLHDPSGNAVELICYPKDDVKNGREV